MEAIVRSWLIAFGVAVGLAGSASAQTFEASPGFRNLSFDLDTFSGAYSTWEDSDLCGLSALRAIFTAPRLGGDNRWVPAVNFVVMRGNERVGVQFSAPTRSRPFAANFVHFNTGQSERIPLTAPLNLEQPTNVGFDWTADGAVTVTVGTESHTLRLSGPVEKIQISNSTGELKILELHLGHVGPAPSCSS